MELITIKNNFWFIKIVEKSHWERMIREWRATLFNKKEDKEERLSAIKEQVVEIKEDEELDLEYLSAKELKEKCDKLWIQYKPSIKKEELITLLK